MKVAFLACAALLVSGAAAAVHFKETFDDTWSSRWQKSSWKKADGSAGEFTLSAGKWFGDAEADKGIQTGPDSKFFATYAAMDSAVDTTGKDLVLQFSVKHEQDLDCGGGYIKLIPASSADKMESFGGDTPYSIMFGPDICGYATKKVHVILTYKGTNYLIKKDIQALTDQLTHVYTLVIKPDNTYQVLVDLKEVASGSLTDDWDMLPPKTIKDPKATKPEDWDENEKIADPEDIKPEGWDDIPATIADPDAKKPEDWDDEEDGTWEAPTLPNPEYKGEWKPKMIDNPAYKGIWVAPDIPNPDFTPDDSLYAFKDLKFVGFELWQVKAGSIFDNIFVGDSLEEAEAFANDTWAKSKDGEKAAFDKGGTVVNHDGQAVADVLVVGERIAAVGLDLKAPEGAYVVNASGKLVMPGGIDPHTHLDMPFMGSVTCDDFFSGQAAALAGGTTMIIDHALPVDHDLMAGWEAWKRKGMEGCMDYSFHMAVTQWSDKTRQDMEALTRMGVNSFKFFMAYKAGGLTSARTQLIRANKMFTTN
ncbi:uncharacterized protein HaLaN_29226 [Haematococcus lacustris]|uniref:Uncharacterized protein n=1 Tax=Haematococcus lacustris TaxID=44745 RepID=A0A6A0ABY9_HAELA|nr:uncharacterized protein HaLaN_29226 [Haematococcus lacustris]